MISPKSLFFFVFISLFLISCENDSAVNGDSIPDSIVLKKNADPVQSFQIAVKTFVVNDSTGKGTGWGYDLYVDGKRTIHQPLIPAVPGTDAFATEDDARKTGEFAMKKMKLTGAFPTLTIEELDSLGVKHQ